MNKGGIIANRIVDRSTGLEIYKGSAVDGNPFYFDMTELENNIRARPGGNGLWTALDAIITAENKRTGGQVSAHIVQQWARTIL